jgi:phosphoglycolate phosphatase-like HAD superfamily hydrolase
MVGDTWKDMEAGFTAGCTTILLDRSYNQGVACDYRTPTLDQAVQLILELHRVMNTKGGK